MTDCNGLSLIGLGPLCVRCANEFTTTEPEAKHCSRACMKRMQRLRKKMRDPQTVCPTPLKTGRYESLAHAWVDARVRGVFAYRCCCGFAHLTKKKKPLPAWVN